MLQLYAILANSFLLASPPKTLFRIFFLESWTFLVLKFVYRRKKNCRYILYVWKFQVQYKNAEWRKIFFDKISKNEKKKIIYLLINYTFNITLLPLSSKYDFSLDKYIYILKKLSDSHYLEKELWSIFSLFYENKLKIHF